MQKSFFALAAVAALGLAVLFIGCGGSSMAPTASTGPTGSLVVFGGDAPICDVLSFQVTITGVTLTPQSGGTPVSVLPSGQSVTLDFAGLIEFASLLHLSSVPVGTYSQITLTLSNPQLTVLNVQTNPPSPQVVTTSLTTSTFSATINPALQVSQNGAAGLKIDFNLLKSVQTDPMTGQVTGTVNPVLNAFVVNQDKDRMADDLHGTVQSVSTTSSNSAYTGSFTMSTAEDSATTFTIYVNSDTKFEQDDESGSASGLSTLAAGTFVEVDAQMDNNGNMVAQEIEVEEPPTQQGTAVVGNVIAVTRDSSGNAMQFTLYVRAVFPSTNAPIQTGTTLPVSVSSTTTFAIRHNGMDEAGLSFGANSLGLDQSVVAIGALQSGATTTLSANTVVLRPQTVLGNFVSLLSGMQSGDMMSGGFTMKPCSDLFGGQTITVLTFGDEDFEGVSNLAGLGPNPTLAAKGLLFYEQSGGSADSVSWTAPTWVLEARRIHQLPQ